MTKDLVMEKMELFLSKKEDLNKKVSECNKFVEEINNIKKELEGEFLKFVKELTGIESGEVHASQIIRKVLDLK